MRILVAGDDRRQQELKQKFGGKIRADFGGIRPDPNSELKNYDLVFDLNFDDHPETISHYEGFKDLTLIAGAVKIQLKKIMDDHQGMILPRTFGMNTLPTFINRPVAEWTLPDLRQKPVALEIAGRLGWEISFAADTVGMVAPRILMMIINEAYHTHGEGTASMEDIDLGMKLGTNYPEGPFVWAKNIGIREVYKTLEALFLSTGDARYEIAPLLKASYNKQAAN